MCVRRKPSHAMPCCVECILTPEIVTMPEVPPKLSVVFEQLMTDPHPAVRFWAARLAREFGAAAKPVLPSLLELCQDAQPAVRWAAVENVQGLSDALCGVRLGD